MRSETRFVAEPAGAVITSISPGGIQADPLAGSRDLKALAHDVGCRAAVSSAMMSQRSSSVPASRGAPGSW